MLISLELEIDANVENEIKTLLLDSGYKINHIKHEIGNYLACGDELDDDLVNQLNSYDQIKIIFSNGGSLAFVHKDFPNSKRAISVTDNYIIDSHHFAIMAGSCAVESEQQVNDISKMMISHGLGVMRGGAYKTRTSPYSFAGMGIEGLELLAQAKKSNNLMIITEVIDTKDVKLVANSCDILQIGTRNMQNVPLLKEVGLSGKPVMLKRGMSATVQEWLLAAEYIMSYGNERVILCERGIRTFSDSTRNTLDLSVVPLLKELTNLPVFVDPSHGTGKSSLVIPMAMASIAAGADGLLIEVHPHPANAKSDGEQSLDINQFDSLMNQMKKLATVMEKIII